MISKLRGRITSAHVIALAALFVALGGTAFAAATIGTNDIKNRAVTKNKLHKKAVTTKKIAKQAVTTGKIAPDAVDSSKILDASVGTDDLADASVTNSKLAPDAVDSSKIQDQSVGNSDLTDGSVNSQKLTTNSVTASKVPIVLRQTNVAIPTNSTASGTASCNPGEQALSGGVRFDGGIGLTDAAELHVVHIYPLDGGWFARGYNNTGENRTMTVYVKCVLAG